MAFLLTSGQEDMFLIYQLRSFGKGETWLSRIRGIGVQLRRESLRNGYHI